MAGDYDIGLRIKETCFGDRRDINSWSAPSKKIERDWDSSVAKAIRDVCGSARALEPLSDDELRAVLDNRNYSIY